jgi:hypothetical protein
MTAARLIAALPGGAPPRGTKLPPETWWRAARLYDSTAGKVRLRALCESCGISHRTAWRLREYLRDADQVAARRETLSPTHNAGE